MGIEPTALAWEARVLPLYDARKSSRAFYDASACFHNSERCAGFVREWTIIGKGQWSLDGERRKRCRLARGIQCRS